MSVRLLVAGSEVWRDGDGVRAGLRWALDRYGYENSTLILAGQPRGATAIAARAWSDFAGVNPEPEIMNGWLGGGSLDLDDVDPLDQRILDVQPQATLIFQVTSRNQRGKLSRAVAKASRAGRIPTWRWSVSLKKVVEAGVDVHQGGRRYLNLDPDYDD